MFTLGNIEEIAENLNIQHPEAHNAATNAKTFRQDSDIFARVTCTASASSTSPRPS